MVAAAALIKTETGSGTFRGLTTMTNLWNARIPIPFWWWTLALCLVLFSVLGLVLVAGGGCGRESDLLRRTMDLDHAREWK